MSSRISTRTVLIVGAVVALLLAGVVSYYASSAPDGLNKVAADQGITKNEKRHHLDDSPLAGYGIDGVDNARLSGGLAGVAGVAVTFAIVGGLVLAVRRGRREETSERR
jgi:hypothetical protein